jgi:hypothetical protein
VFLKLCVIFTNYVILSTSSELKSPTVHLIREIYETDNAHDHFIAALDRALVEKVDYIIIEPNKLGGNQTTCHIVP